MRTAYFCDPKTATCATPSTMEMRCASRVSAYSSTVERESVGEESAMYKIGWSAGFTFWYEGGAGIPLGSCREAFEMADCTSCAAASMFRSKTNWIVTCVEP